MTSNQFAFSVTTMHVYQRCIFIGSRAAKKLASDHDGDPEIYASMHSTCKYSPWNINCTIFGI